jgi:superfamily II DNA or RNA helicase
MLQYQDTNSYTTYAAELKFLTSDETRLNSIATKILEISKTGNTLVLVGRIETGKYLQTVMSSETSLLSDKPDVAFVSGDTKTNERTETYKDINEASNQIVIATFGVAAVGINIPRIFNVVMIEPGKSFVRVIQSIGRDKDFVNIWDITSSCKFSKRHAAQRVKYYNEAKYENSTTKIKYK